jgi:glycine hydroxymethyltransferase
MIPSENLPSKYVLGFMATEVNNKYAEGYPGKRYYTGNKYIDQIESLAINRAKKIFNMAHANVQPHSGSDANYQALSAVLEPGDKVLSMALPHGGHISHGLPVNFSGKLYDVVHYGVSKDTELIDYDALEELAKKEKPKLIISGASAYPRQINFEKISQIAHDIGAYHLADISHIAGLIVAGLHPSAHSADIITTTTHKTLRGPRGAIILCTEALAQKIDRAVFPGFQGGPMEHVIAAKAANLNEIVQPEFAKYQRRIIDNAKELERVFINNSIKLVTNGTDNHLLLIDLTKLGIDGHEIALALEKAKIYTNKNVIPFDEKTPYRPSGLRLGTPYLTARGMGTDEMKEIGQWIVQIIKNPKDETLIDNTRNKVEELTEMFPLYNN